MHGAAEGTEVPENLKRRSMTQRHSELWEGIRHVDSIDLNSRLSLQELLIIELRNTGIWSRTLLH